MANSLEISSNLEVMTDKNKFTIELRKFYNDRNDNSSKLEWTTAQINKVITAKEGYNLANVLKQPKSQQQYRPQEIVFMGQASSSSDYS